MSSGIGSVYIPPTSTINNNPFGISAKQSKSQDLLDLDFKSGSKGSA
jgi:hypothetical protein